MKLIVLVNNVGVRYPKDWVLAEIWYFKNFLKEETMADVEVIINYQDEFYELEIPEKNITREKTIDSDPVDGIVVSMTVEGAERILENSKTKKKFISILERLKNKRLLIFCTGKPIFQRLVDSKALSGFNVVFQKKIGVKWFNYQLRKTALENFL